jgi:hypothetical protein
LRLKSISTSPGGGRRHITGDRTISGEDIPDRGPPNGCKSAQQHQPEHNNSHLCHLASNGRYAARANDERAGTATDKKGFRV